MQTLDLNLTPEMGGGYRRRNLGEKQTSRGALSQEDLMDLISELRMALLPAFTLRIPPPLDLGPFSKRGIQSSVGVWALSPFALDCCFL